MKSIITLISLVSIFFGLAKNENFSNIFNWAERQIFYKEISVLYQKIREDEVKKIFSKNRVKELEIVSLELHPYLLMDVKFISENHTSKEGTLIWGLHHGEMVMNTDNWDITNGIGDCIRNNVTREEMAFLKLVHEKDSKIMESELTETRDSKKICKIVNNCKRKKLAFQLGEEIHLHIKDPIWLSGKETVISNSIRQSSKKSEDKTISKRFTQKQISSFAEKMFGESFVVRSQKTIYLPVYLVMYEDENKRTKSVRFNAITGKIYNARVFS